MDLLFIEGVAAVVAAVIVFVGSVWMLLAVIMGARLAYFVTASVTLGFIFIMTLVWSYGDPLGPVGRLPDWEGISITDTAAGSEFGPAGEYPEQPWEVAAEDDDEAKTKAAELESAAIDYLEDAINEGEGAPFLSASDATVVADSARLFQDGEKEYGAIELGASTAAIEKAEDADPDQDVTPPNASLIVVMEYDPGNPMGKARMIAGGTFLVFALHLFGLGRAERKTAEEMAFGEGAR